MASIFTRIINGDIPNYKIAENDRFYAFLDINPLKQGHTLVVPKQEVDYIFDLEDEILGEMMIFAKKVAKKIKLAMKSKRVAVVVLGLEVPHAHIHLIPLDKESDVDFSRAHLKPSSEELKTTQRAILNN